MCVYVFRRVCVSVIGCVLLCELVCVYVCVCLFAVCSL